jgi:WD40 repeat protein
VTGSTRTRWLTVAMVGLGLALGPSPAASGEGRQLWAQRYDGPAHDRDLALSVAVSPDGSKVFSTGGSLGATSGYDYATAAYDSSTGVQLWGEPYNGKGNGDDFAESIAASPSNSVVFVTGETTEVGGDLDYATVAYDSLTGAQLWVSRYNGEASSFDSAYSIAVSPDGARVFVTGASIGVATSTDVATVAYDAATGAQLWVSRYNGPANDVDLAAAVAVGPGGSRLFVTGRSEGPTRGEDYLTVSYDAATGAQLWARTYNGPSNDSDLADAIGVSPGGSKLFVTGWSIGATRNWDYATVAYSASTGDQLWVRRYDGPGHGDDRASSLAVSPGGSRVFVTGLSEGTALTGFDFGTVAYSASTGKRLWLDRYDSPRHDDDLGNFVAASPGGSKVFVTGDTSDVTGRLEWTTVAYAAGGAQLWVTHLEVGGAAISAAASPDGSKVFVAGFSSNPTTDDDFVTVAYSA